MRKLIRIPALALFVVLVAACGPDSADRGKAAAPGRQRVMLSEGYSMLYADAAKIDAVNLILYLKFESQEFNDVITEIAAYGDDLKKDLKRIAGNHPGLRIDLDALPEMERRKRAALAWDRTIRFSPLGGASRLEYERVVLISLAGALDHERHLCAVMAAEEPDPALKKFLLASERRYRDLQERVMNLLNREHFKRNMN